jgi:hypothetical protein
MQQLLLVDGYRFERNYSQRNVKEYHESGDVKDKNHHHENVVVSPNPRNYRECRGKP